MKSIFRNLSSSNLILALLTVQVLISVGLFLRISSVYRIVNNYKINLSVLEEFEKVEGVSADDDPYLGPETTQITIVEFADYTCSHCKETISTLDHIRENYGNKVKIVYRDFPLTGENTTSFQAAIAAYCAREQDRFWEMYDLLYDLQPIMDISIINGSLLSIGVNDVELKNCMVSSQAQFEVLNDRDQGISYGVTSTPTFFINGYKLVGSQPYSVFQRVIENILNGQVDLN